MEVINRKDINVRYSHKLVKVDGDKRIAWYEITKDVKVGGCILLEDKTSKKDVDETINYNPKKVEIVKDNNLI